MIARVISGGQTGVDRAALDMAIRLDIPCGGWCPRGRLAEDGVISPVYPLVETPSSQYEERTEWNVRDSDGTLVLTWGPPSEGTGYTVFMARRHGRPYLVVDLAENPTVAEAVAWIADEKIRVLNVAGPRASKCPRIYDFARGYLEQLFIAAGKGRTSS
ncbi:MAG TPA: putative molybdenum carrier protein [Candidatus Hydrogenedentes bacterium]|nr:putative molybdenum carrier protein [Candidatus Hydrogenedentota bacterium]HOV73915.1 putative molybdenum carrier protein [Candidatus Hydrogenedentota bacterium]